MKRTCDGVCARFQLAMDVLAKPWTGLLLAALEEAKGPQRFCALAERLPQIGDRMLSARLKELHARGLVERLVEAGPPVQVAYRLSEAGRGFTPVRRALSGWGEALAQAERKGRRRG